MSHLLAARGWWRRFAVTAPVACALMLSACAAQSTAMPLTTTRASTDPAPSTQAQDRGVAPVTMRIPAIGIDARVDPVGTKDRVLQIPPQPWVVGWWEDGVGVGAERGAVVMTAHLDSRRYGTGPFARAKNLEPGDPMVLRDADGGSHRYSVSAVDTYRKVALPYSKLFSQRGPVRVVLVTCGGNYNAAAGGWDSNVVVTFSPQK